MPPACWRLLCRLTVSGNFPAYLIQKILDLGAVFVTGSGNTIWRVAPYGYPALLGDPGHPNHVPDLIVVGASNPDGGLYDRGAVAEWVTCYAPGKVWIPVPVGEFPYSPGTGTSIGMCLIIFLLLNNTSFHTLEPLLRVPTLMSPRTVSIDFS